MPAKIFLDISPEMCFNVSPLLVVERLRLGTLSSMSGGCGVVLYSEIMTWVVVSAGGAGIGEHSL